MKSSISFRAWPALLLVAIALTCLGAVLAAARSGQAPKLTAGELVKQVGIDARLGSRVPSDIRLRDEAGDQVAFGELNGGKPVILALVYYKCPMLCTMTMDGLLRSLNELTLTAGEDFTVLTVSFDPRETAELAAAAKRTAMSRYRRVGAQQGWRFLTGQEAEVGRLAEAVGFRYRFDESTGQYAHAAGLVVLSSDGVISRYLYGIDFPPRDLRLAVVEASQGKVGSLADRVLLLCFHYDPASGRYGLAVMRVLRVAGLATVIGLGAAIVTMIRRDRKRETTWRAHAGEPTEA